MLRTQGITRVASDVSSSLLALESLDLAEVVGCTIGTLCNAASNVVADEVCMSIVRGSITPVLRRADKIMAHGLSEILASTFSNHVGHPLLDKDRTIVKLRLYDGPTYYSRTSRPLHRITTYVTGNALAKIENTASRFYLRKICLFSSESEMGVFNVYLTTLTRLMMYCYHKRGITWTDIKDIMGRFILPTMRSDQDESHKVKAVLITCSTLIPWLKSRNMYVASGYLEKLSQSEVILGIAVSVKEAVRMLRPLPEEQVEDVKIKPRNRARISQLPKEYVTKKMSHASHTPCGPIIPEKAELGMIRSRHARMARHCGRELVFGCSSTSMWTVFGEIFRDRSVIVIGSGQGAVAAASIMSGATHVFGLDTTDSLPLRPHRFLNYKPPAIIMQGSQSQYTQMSQSYTMSGDWRDDSVSDSVCRTYDSGDTAFVIDIEAGSTRYGLDLIDPLIRNDVRGPVLMRCFWTDIESNSFLTSLEISGGKFRLYNISDYADIRTRVLYISKLPKDLGYYYPSDVYCVPGDRYLTVPPSKSSTKELIEEATFNLISVTDEGTIASVLVDLIKYRESLVGVYESRLSYERWTLIMQAIVSLWWVSRPVRDRARLLTEWSSRSSVLFPLKNHSFELKYSGRFELHLTGPVSRLSSPADRKYLLQTA
jgi:hypothetical protein